MADYEKCGDCSVDSGEDKQKGVCLIKKEYVDIYHVAYVNYSIISEFYININASIYFLLNL